MMDALDVKLMKCLKLIHELWWITNSVINLNVCAIDRPIAIDVPTKRTYINNFLALDCKCKYFNVFSNQDCNDHRKNV